MSTINSTNSASSGSSAIYNTSSRITGMFSSLDTDALVKSMTSTQQARIDAVRQKQTRQEWYNDSLKGIKDEINEFLNTYTSQTGELSMLKAASYSTYSAVTSSTANAVSVTPSSASDMDNLSIQINQLAENASATSSKKISKFGTEISSSNTATLEKLSLATPLKFNADNNISFAINGKTFSFSKDTTLQNMINTINTDKTANVTMKYSRLSDTFTVTSDSGGTGSSLKIENLQGNAFGTNGAFGIGDIVVTRSGASVSSEKISAGGTMISPDDTTMLADLSLAKPLRFDSNDNISFSINGKVFTFSKTTTLKYMMDTIKNDPTAKVTMGYFRTTDGFSIMSDAGSNGNITIQNISGNAFGTNGAFGIAEETIKRGTDSVAVINGTTVTKDSNGYTIDGITYDLKKVTKGTDEEAVSFALQRDTSAALSSISKFIDGYNKLYAKLNDLVSEADYSADYPPLTDAQKDDMSEAQITAWEKKAKSGLLRNNKDLTYLMSGLKNSFFSALGGTKKNATEIGITVAGYFDSNPGQLLLDEGKFKEALNSAPDTVISMFTNGSSTAAASEQGLMYKIKSSITEYTSTVTDVLKIATKQIDTYDTEISDLEDKLGQLADRYYAKFSRMETALSKLNSQSSYISQLFQ